MRQTCCGSKIRKPGGKIKELFAKKGAEELREKNYDDISPTLITLE